MRNEPFRYRPKFGSPDPKKCAAGMSRGRVTFEQCSKPRLPDSEWCASHKPLVAGDDAPRLYVVEDNYSGGLDLVSAKILKETSKQIKLEGSTGSGFGYRNTIAKNEDGTPEMGARTAVAAAERHLAEKEQALQRLLDAAKAAQSNIDDAKLFLEETKKGAAPSE